MHTIDDLLALNYTLRRGETQPKDADVICWAARELHRQYREINELKDEINDLKKHEMKYLQFYTPHLNYPPEMNDREMIPYQAGEWVKIEDVKQLMSEIENRRNKWELMESLLNGDEIAE